MSESIEMQSDNIHIYQNIGYVGYIDIDNMCGIIKFDTNKKYLVDFDDFNKFVFLHKKFTFNNETDIYPSYNNNYKRINLLNFLHNIDDENIIYSFKNNNNYDLRKNNIKITHNFHKKISENYYINEFINGHYIKAGCDSNKMKNPLWKVIDKTINKAYILMYCEKDTIIKLCEKSYEKILEFEKTINNGKKITFYKHSNGYILCSNKSLFIHQIITECYGNGKGTKNMSVDHIDQDPLNNTYDNLRIATREEQEQNSKGIKEGTKRERKHNAKELPNGITQEMLPKYVVYYKECYNKEKDLYREFFKIERHPKLGKSWNSSKSNKVTIKEKLQQTFKIINDLDNNIQPQEKKTLPLYITITNTANKSYLVYDKRDENGKRKNYKMILHENYDIETELLNFNQKILEKYPDS